MLSVFQSYVLHTQSSGVENGFMNATTSASDFATCEATDYSCLHNFSSSFNTDSTSVLILGNSQLGAINNRHSSDQNYGSLVSINLSKLRTFPIFSHSIWLPNASLQEFYIVYSALSECLSEPDILVLPVFLDDTRESQIRPELDSYFNKICESSHDTPSSPLSFNTAEPSYPDNSVYVTNYLRSSLPFLDFSRLQNANSYLRGNIYLFRNYVFGITSQSKRAIIPSAYKTNISYLRKIIDLRSSKHLTTIVYIPPVYSSPHISIPYIQDEYNGFVSKIEALCRLSDCSFFDLDSLISHSNWILSNDGVSYKSSEPDFMHFGSFGHTLLSTELTDIIQYYLPPSP